MSLKTNWQEAPKVITTGRTVRYSAEPTSWADSAGNTVDLYWTVRRVSSMAFNILALTQSAAEAGAAALQREYTRKYARWTAETDTSQSPPSVRVLKSNALLCTSSITPRLAQGSIWHIEATIDEEDTIVADHEPTYDEFEELFALALAREEADDGGAAFVIDEAHWDSTTGRITMFWSAANIDGFAPANVTVQIHRGSWQSATVVPGTLGAGGCQIESATNAAVRAVYNLGQSGEVATAPYRTNDPEMPEITLEPATYTDGQYVYLTFAATGAPSALSGVSDISRWRARLYSGATLLNPVTDRVAQLIALGGGRYEATFSPATDVVLREWFNDTGGELAVTLVYFAGDNSASASGTIIRRNYVDALTAETVDALPDATRIRLVLASDIPESVIKSATLNVSATVPKPSQGTTQYTGTVERLTMIDPAATPPQYSAMVKFPIAWSLATADVTVRGSFAAADFGVNASFYESMQVDFQLRSITGANFDESANKTYLTLFAWDAYAGWVLSAMDWSYLDGDTWDTFYPTPSASSIAPTFSGFADDNLALTPIRAQGDGYDLRYYPASAQYLRILGVAVADTDLSIVLDWRINGLTTVAILEGCTLEATIDGNTVAQGAEVVVRGDTLAFAWADASPGDHELTIRATYNAGANIVYSEPFAFTIAGGQS